MEQKEVKIIGNIIFNVSSEFEDYIAGPKVAERMAKGIGGTPLKGKIAITNIPYGTD